MTNTTPEGFWFLDDRACATCNGAGGKSTREWQGDGWMGAHVWLWDDCPACLGQRRCPGCGEPIEMDGLTIDEVACAFEDCGWRYEAEREYHDEED